jgi:hypothetical protein
MNEHGLYDIYSVWHVPFWKTQFFYASISIFVVLFFLMLALILYKWYKMRKKSISLWDQASADLQALLMKQESVSNLYAQLTHILKKYISDRYACDLYADTDAEFIFSIKKLDIPSQVCMDIESILEGVTEIKFSNISVARVKLEEAVRQAVQCVQRTIPLSK